MTQRWNPTWTGLLAEDAAIACLAINSDKRCMELITLCKLRRTPATKKAPKMGAFARF
jgi:hypothetical protein